MHVRVPRSSRSRAPYGLVLSILAGNRPAATGTVDRELVRGTACHVRVPALVAALLATSAPRAVSNLNGFHYGVANAPQLGRNFSLASRARQYVDVYTPIISSLYSQVQWSPHGVALPADLVTAFDGRVMNIVG
jgi:hypothetical protein